MPSLSAVAAFAAVSFALIIVPGPSVMFVVGRAVALGRRAALLTVIGNAVGVYVQLLLVAAGLGVIVERSIVVFTAVKLVGAGYLAWLGIQAIRHRRRLGATLDGDGPTGPQRSALLEGFVVGIANPKAMVFFAAILPQFVDPGGAPAAMQMALLGLVFVAIALVSDGLWAVGSGTARDWFARSPQRLERLAVVGGLTMIGLGVQLAVTGRKD